MLGIGVFAASKSGYKTNEKPQVAKVASQHQGVIILHVKLGQKVKKGQLLFGINTDILKAKLENDKSNIIHTTFILEKAKKLFAHHAISKNDYQQCIRDYLTAKSSYKSNLAKINQCEYYSPFDGTVTNIVRYDGSGLDDNDDEIEVTQGNINVDISNIKALVCTRWPGVLSLKVATSPS